MKPIFRSILASCLLLALAACSSTGRRGAASAIAVQPVVAAPDPAAAEVPGADSRSRADQLLAEGDRLQEQGRCRDALQHYGMAALESGPGQARALASIYLCHWQLQRPRAAEEGFTLWLRHELDQGRLRLRLLFQPGESRYLADARISAPYAAWLRRVADATQAGSHCLVLHGHAGPSALERHATGLALRRAQMVQRQLEALAPALKGRISSSAADGEAVIGSASDDLRDALDRRVEFAIGAC